MVLIYFGYTHCMMQCPLNWINPDKVMRDLGPARDHVASVFIFIDPARDTVERTGEWQRNWETITALTGTKQQIHDVATKFHIFCGIADLVGHDRARQCGGGLRSLGPGVSRPQSP